MNIAVVIALLYILAVGLALCLAFAARRIRRSRPVAVGVFLLGSVLAALHADKPTPVPSALLRWDRGLADNGSIATNDTVFIRGTYDPLMANDALHVDYRDRTITDSPDGWARAYDGAVGDLADGFTVTIPDATNMVVWIWSEYVEPAPTHTNGEYRIIYVGRIDGGAADAPRYVTPRTPVRGDARCSARDYVQDGLIAMWDGIDHGNDPLIWRDLSGNGYDATQRVANAGWSWDGDCYRGTSGNGHGFRMPQALVDFFRSNITNHTVEIVYRPTASRRETILGQYHGTPVGLNIEYAPHLAGNLRVYWGANPDLNSPAWKTLGMVRMTTTMLCNGTNCQIYENGAYKTQAAQPNVDRVGVQSLIIGGENSRSNMSICGELCIVRIYSRALTAEEIAHNYKIDSIRFGLPGAPSAVVPLSPPSLPPPAQSLFSTLATENLTE